MKAIFQAVLLAGFVCGSACVQAQTYGPPPAAYESLGTGTDPQSVLSQLPPKLRSEAYVNDGQVYLPKADIVGLNYTSGTAAGSAALASQSATGSAATVVALGVAVFGVVAAVLVGTSNNSGSSATTTTK